MKRSTAVLLSICLVLGIAMTVLALYATDEGLAAIHEKLALQKRQAAAAKAAELLGTDIAVDLGEMVELTRAEQLALLLGQAAKPLLVLGIDLMIAGVMGLVRARIKRRRQSTRASTPNNILGILLAFGVLCLNLALSTDKFLTAQNLLNVMQQISINFVIAVGMTFVIISGGIDLSVGSNIALTGLLMAILMKNYSVATAPAIAVSLVFSAVVGLINGVMVARLDLPPFIATLGMMSIARGAAYTVTGGQPLYTMPEAFTAISGRVRGVPLYAGLIMAAVFTLGWYMLRYTRQGRFTYAIGGNENCARLSGIDIGRVKMLVYTLSGLCCGVAALLLTSRLDSALPTNADGQEMDAIAAVVIGGTSMKGGEGGMIGTLIGILIIGIISNGLNLLGVAQGPQKMVKGLIIVVAVIIDVLRRKAAEAGK
ncbi:ABC transporter permease [Bacillota bacterium Meth-B3]